MIVPLTSGVVTSSRSTERLTPVELHPSSTAKPFQLKALPTSTSTGSVPVVGVVAAAGSEGWPAQARATGATPRQSRGPHEAATKVSRSCRVSDADGLAVLVDQHRVGLLEQRRRRRPPASVEPMVGSAGGHVVLDPVGQLGVCRRRARRAGSAPRPSPATSAATIGGSARTTGIWLTPYSWRMWTASAIVSPGWVCTRSGSWPDLPRSTSPTVRWSACGAGGEAVLAEPLVVEDLGEVAAAGVGQQDDDHGVGAPCVRRARGRAGGRRRPPCRTSRRRASPPRGRGDG